MASRKFQRISEDIRDFIGSARMSMTLGHFNNLEWLLKNITDFKDFNLKTISKRIKGFQEIPKDFGNSNEISST